MREDSVAWKAVNALIDDARANFKGERQEAFAWAVYNAVRRTDPEQLKNLIELLGKCGLEPTPGDEPERSWIN
jgi:hypothetical protein